MKIKTKLDSRCRDIVRAFNQTHTGVDVEHVMRHMRGNIKAKVFMIAPPASAAEYKAGVPLADDRGKIFHNLLIEQGYHTEHDFLIASCSSWGVRPNKASTIPVQAFINESARRGWFTRYVCVGDEAFKFLFANGYKSSMQTLAGSIIYVSETAFKPLFVFPPLTALAPILTGEDERADYFAERAETEAIRRIRLILPQFTKFMEAT